MQQAASVPFGARRVCMIIEFLESTRMFSLWLFIVTPKVLQISQYSALARSKKGALLATRTYEQPNPNCYNSVGTLHLLAQRAAESFWLAYTFSLCEVFSYIVLTSCFFFLAWITLAKFIDMEVEELEWNLRQWFNVCIVVVWTKEWVRDLSVIVALSKSNFFLFVSTFVHH